MKRLFRILLVAPLLMAQTEADDAAHVTSSSSEFLASTKTSVEQLDQAGFLDRLSSPTLGAVPQATITAAQQRIRANSQPATATGDRNVTYDVIIQPGHFGRRSGATGTAGDLVSEQQLAAYVAGVTAQRLRQKNLNVLLVPADGVPSGLKTKAFLAIHADGSVRPCSTGPSLGYPRGLTPYAMHAIGLATSRALGYQYSEFRPDNFTANEAQYYMFNKVQASHLTGLLEVGELTCRESEERAVVGSTRLGNNLAEALEFIVKL